MENVVKNFDLVKEEISNFKNANIIAVSKTFPISHILPLINHGHHHFGENKVQEAQEKWTSLKNDFPNLKLHLIASVINLVKCSVISYSDKDASSFVFKYVDSKYSCIFI